jgi:hypothetical protein
MPARGTWKDRGAVLVAVEKPMSRRGRGSDVLAYALGAIVSSIEPEVPVELVRADDWRRGLGMKTRADRRVHKAASVAFATEHWTNGPELGAGGDAADAFCIAWDARARLEARETSS